MFKDMEPATERRPTASRTTSSSYTPPAQN
jgi:hypothetical protein